MKLHANAALSLRQRLRMVDRVLQQGWTISAAAAAAEVSERTCSKWVARYRVEGELGSARSLLGAASAWPTAPTSSAIEAIAALRRLRFTGPEIAEVLDDAALDGLGHPDADRDGQARPARPGARRALRARAAGRADPHRRQEARPHPGRRRQTRPRRAPPALQPARAPTATASAASTVGWDYVHIAIDDCTRLAYAEVLPDEKATTAIAFLRRALAFYARHGITVERRHDRQRLRLPLHRARPRLPRARASATCAPAPTAPRPTAKPNASSAPCSAAGPTARSTAQAENAPPPLTAGSGTTTITDDTQPSAANRPSHG